MSQEGYEKLVAELRHMEQVELPAVRDAIAEARAQGDLSENFEYHAAKREQGRLLGRIRFKQRVLENARVIDTKLLAKDTVQLLSKVEMTNLNNNARMSEQQRPHDLYHCQSPRGQPPRGQDIHQVAHCRGPIEQKSRRRGRSTRACWSVKAPY